MLNILSTNFELKRSVLLWKQRKFKFLFQVCFSTKQLHSAQNITATIFAPLYLRFRFTLGWKEDQLWQKNLINTLKTSINLDRFTLEVWSYPTKSWENQSLGLESSYFRIHIFQSASMNGC